MGSDSTTSMGSSIQQLTKRRFSSSSFTSSPAGKDYEGYIPLWFERKVDPITGDLICAYKGGYWEAKDKQDWSSCPDIF